MGVRTSVEVEAGVVVVRHLAPGDDPDAVRRLQQRAERLTRAAGPGVVAVVRSGAVDDGWELVTQHGGTPIDLVSFASSAELAATLAEAAAALAELHRRGLVHGEVTAADVLVGRDGRARLCGFAPEPSTGPPDDVARLAAAGLALLEQAPDRDRASRLAGVLRAATAEDPTHRPGARRLAADLTALAAGSPSGAARRTGPAATPRTEVHPDRIGARPPRPPSARETVAAVVLAAALVLLVVVLVGRGRAGPAAGGVAARGGPASSAPSTTAPAGQQDPHPQGAPGAGPPPVPPCVAGADRPSSASGGCPIPMAVEEGAVVVGPDRWSVGRPGDHVLVGDWGCAGVPRAARLQPATGEVLVYRLPVGGAPVVERAERLPGATELVATIEGACPALHVQVDGSLLRVG